MKIDFRKIELVDLEGNKSTIDVSKTFGNAIFRLQVILENLILHKIYTGKEKLIYRLNKRNL